jgi:tetratricopeptide (TPR) repeat protein
MRKLGLLFQIVLVLLLATACNRDPKVASKKYVEIGNKYYTRDKYKEASILYRKALQKDKKNADAYYHLALVDLKLRQVAEAAGWLQRAVQLDPSNVDASSKLADLYLASYLQNPSKRKDELDEVRNISNTLLKKNPNSFDGLRLKAYLMLAANDIPGAINAFESARRVKLNQPELILTLCQALIANNQADYAKTLATQLVAANKSYGPGYDLLYAMAARAGKNEEAEAILKEKIANNPNVGQYRIQLASHYLRLKQRDQFNATIEAMTSNKSIPNGRMLAGDFYLNINQSDQAMSEFKKGEEETATDKSLYQKRQAEVLVAEGKFPEAAKVIDDIVRRDPKDSEGIVMRSSLRMRNGTVEDVNVALTDLQNLLNKAPDSANIHMVHFNLGRAYLARYELQKGTATQAILQGDLDQAKIHLDQAIQIAATKAGTNFSRAKLALAQVYIYKGDGVRAVQQTNDVLNGEPLNMAALMLRSSANIDLKKFDEARADLDAVLKVRPDDKNAQYQLAMANFLDGKYAAADPAFEALSKAGDNRGTLGLIDSKNKQGKYNDARQVIEAAMPKAPNPNFYKYMLANTLAQSGQYDEAIDIFKKLIESSPKALDLQIRLAETYVRAGKADQAIGIFEKAHEMAPNDVYPLLRAAVLNSGNGHVEQARQQYEAALKIQPDNPMALNNVAFMKAESGIDLDQALTMAQRASQQSPEDINIKDTLAYIYTRKGLTDEGLRILREIIVKQPANANFHYHLALALYQKGDKPSAKRELTTALQSRPTNDQQRKIQELLQKVG